MTMEAAELLKSNCIGSSLLKMKGKKALNRKNVGVIGFNARPIACSCAKAGAEVYVSDYWGDSDLSTCCSEWVSILASIPGKRQREARKIQADENLVSNFCTAFPDIAFDHILVGSGFDGRAHELQPILKKWEISGNSIERMQLARNLSVIEEILEGTNIRVPRYEVVNSYTEFTSAVLEVGLPCVLKPVASGGGSGIRLIRSEADLIAHEGRLKSTQMEGKLVQEYVAGFDSSVSLMSTGDRAVTLSINGQLIGMPSTGRNCDFVYCGNYIPFKTPHHMSKSIREGSEKICNELGLRGSNGIDYVVDESGNIWLMEINPRIQGTLEMLEASSTISVSSMHLKALAGRLPEKIPSFPPTVKMIVYAQRNG
ncbi:ATP-grasp domain-containing protein, partial [Candidatus Thorarchaeota archaeon]